MYYLNSETIVKKNDVIYLPSTPVPVRPRLNNYQRIMLRKNYSNNLIFL